LSWARRRPFDAWFLLGAVLAFGLYGWLARGAFPLGSRVGTREHYYTVAALALLHGHLWVPRQSLTFECFIVRGHCYGYFGIAPSLLRLPVVWILGTVAKTLRFEEIMFLLGFLTTAGGGWWICRQLVALWAPSAGPRARAVMGLASSVAGVGASPLLFLVSRPFVYEEALLWGVAFASVALGAAISLSLRPRFAALVILLAADTLGMLSRPTVGASALFATVVLGVGFLRRGHGTRLEEIPPRHRRWGVTLLLGAFVAFGSAPLVAYMKFHTFSPPYKDQRLLARYDPTALPAFEHFGGLNPVVFPTKVLSALRPDTLGWQDHPPFVTLQEIHPFVVWPAKASDIAWNPNAGITVTLAFDSVATVVALALVLAGLLHRRRAGTGPPGLAVTVSAMVLVSCLGPLALGMLFPGQAYRYAADWMPLFFAGVAVCLGAVAARLATRRYRAASAIVAGCILLGGQLLIQTSLATQNALTTGGAQNAVCHGAANPFGALGRMFCPD
jgi:hypothetical protein